MVRRILLALSILLLVAGMVESRAPIEVSDAEYAALLECDDVVVTIVEHPSVPVSQELAQVPRFEAFVPGAPELSRVFRPPRA